MADLKKSQLKLYTADNDSPFVISHSATGTDLTSTGTLNLKSVVNIDDGVSPAVNDFVSNYNTFKALEASHHSTHTATTAQLQTDLSQEVVDRVAQGGSLSTQLQAEATSRASQDTVLDNKIDSEVATLTTALSDETSARTSAISALTADVNNKHTTAITALSLESGIRENAINGLSAQISNILSNTDAGALDSLSEIVASLNSQGTNLSGLITALDNRLTSLESTVSNHSGDP
mgnify:CR=1 FL=1